MPTDMANNTDDLVSLDWANGWGETPEIVRKCQEARGRGEKHDVREGNGPWSCTHVVECHTCKYKYMYDSGD